jgi:hypothetical protein
MPPQKTMLTFTLAGRADAYHVQNDPRGPRQLHAQHSPPLPNHDQLAHSPRARFVPPPKAAKTDACRCPSQPISTATPHRRQRSTLPAPRPQRVQLAAAPTCLRGGNRALPYRHLERHSQRRHAIPAQHR